MGSEFKNKLFGELKRRFDSGTRAVVNGVNKAIGKGGNPQQRDQGVKDVTKPVV